MTIKQLLTQGPTHRNEHGDEARILWAHAHTLARYERLPGLVEARRHALLAAHRRTNRRCGLPLNPLPSDARYRNGQRYTPRFVGYLATL